MTSNPDYLTPAKHHFRWEVVKYTMSFCVIAGGIGAFLFLKSLAKVPETRQTDALIQQVDTYEVQPYSGLLDMLVTGIVVPHREIKIATEVGGRVAKKYAACEAGNYVTKGEKLVEIDSEEYELEIKTLEAEVLQAEKRIEENRQQIIGEESNILLARQDLQLQARELERNKRLRGVLSQTELDQAQRALNSAQTQLTNRESNLATLKAGTARLEAALELTHRRLEMAELNLRRTCICAPEDGIIVREIAQEGDFVSKGTQIVMFEDTKQSEVLCNLTPTDLNWIRDHSKNELDLIENDPLAVYRIPKTDVTIFDPDEPSVTWRGTLERFDGIGRDEVTKTIPCRIAVASPIVHSESGPRALVRGMYVKCRVEVQTTADEKGHKLFSFPAVALHPNDHIWIVDDNQKLKSVIVDVVDWTETIRDGKPYKIVVVKTQDDSLKVDDRVVTSPLSQPTVGAPVILRGEKAVDAELPDVPKVASDLAVDADDESQVSSESNTSSLQ